MLLGSDYKDFNLVLAQSGGRPYEPRQIDQMLSTFIQENELRSGVFHRLRHSSTSLAPAGTAARISSSNAAA